MMHIEDIKQECRYICVFWILFFVLLSFPCFAKVINFDITVDRTKVFLGDSIRLNLTFYNTQDIPSPGLPDIDGIETSYIGPSTRMSIVNGKVSSSITHIYKLIPLRIGTFKIGPLSFEYKGDTYIADEIIIEVIDNPDGGSQRTGESTGYNDEIKDRIFLVMEPAKRKAYLNEIIPLTIRLYVNRIAVRDIQYPQFMHDGFSVHEFDKPRHYQEVLGGILYDVVEFNTEIFGTRPGEFMLGPALLKCSVVIRKKRSKSFFDDFFDEDIFEDFFNRYRVSPIKLKSTQVPITILPIPEEGRPEYFNGAVGDFDFELQVNPREIRVGDPVTLRMAIKGKGNFDTVVCPELHSQKDFKVYEPQVKYEEGLKIFEQILIPKKDSIKEIPEISFSFFNPIRKIYRTISKGPTPIVVLKPEEGEDVKIIDIPELPSTSFKKEVLGRDIIYIKDIPGRLRPKGEMLCKNKIFIALQFIPILMIISVLIFQRRKDHLLSDVRYARRLQATRKIRRNMVKLQKLLESGQPNKFFDAVFKTLQEYLGDRFYLPTSGISSDVIDKLKLHISNNELLDKLKECFDNCDMVRYAHSEATEAQMRRTFVLFEEIIDALERGREYER